MNLEKQCGSEQLFWFPCHHPNVTAHAGVTALNFGGLTRLLQPTKENQSDNYLELTASLQGIEVRTTHCRVVAHSLFIESKPICMKAIGMFGSQSNELNEVLLVTV